MNISIEPFDFGFQTVSSVCIPVEGELERVRLLAPPVALKNRAVNLSTVLEPGNVGAVTYYWWLDNKTEVSPPRCCGRKALLA